MKRRFYLGLQKAVAEAKQFMETSISEGQVINFFTKEEREEDDILSGMPVVSKVGKYGDYSQFAVTSVDKKNHKILLHLEGTSEGNDGEKKSITLEDVEDSSYLEISDTNICYLADEIEDNI